jgi:hypothetical protein
MEKLIRYSDYEIRQRKLYGVGQWDTFPLNINEFTSNLMNVHDQAALIRFAREFGFLGYERIHRPSGAAETSRQTKTKPTDKRQLETALLNFKPYRHGEPTEWIFAHARTMRTLLHTDSLLKQFRATRSDSLLKQITLIWRTGPFAIGLKLMDEGLDIGGIAGRRWRTFLTEQWGLAEIEVFLGGNIRAVYPKVAFGIMGEPMMEFGFTAPIERAYFQLWQDIVGANLRLCKTCAKIFRTEDSRSVHCSTQCRQLWATRNFRKRQKEAGGSKVRKS